MSSDFDELLRTGFPENTDQSVLRAISQGVALADDVRRNTPWLTNLVGTDARGHLRRAAVMWSFQQACSSGELPFDAVEVPNSNGSAHLLEICSGKFEAHIVRTDSAKSFPQDAPIRQDKSLKNDADLFEDGHLAPFEVITARVATNYAWLSFNADRFGNLSHVGWAMPAAERKVLLGFVSVLRTNAHREEFSDFDEHAPPKPDPLAKVHFKESIEQALNDNKPKSGSGDT